MGIHVFHPAPGHDCTLPSIAGLSTSLDAKGSRYSTSILVQAGFQVTCLVWSRNQGILKILLPDLRKKTKIILLYRDGILDNQFKTVLEL
ncbi:9654_t:CDS:2 [Funneliformis caledonium]|uniref:9654_t:CDS:1 n=1 Tax=Funneliformis caledonium TaxID=1117310 RepID=A0A9N9CEH0_9GLOM|nr:9654_t:CDS:2 [Funneliformis caledonium]